jgi:hypothetical protein
VECFVIGIDESALRKHRLSPFLGQLARAANLRGPLRPQRIVVTESGADLEARGSGGRRGSVLRTLFQSMMGDSRRLRAPAFPRVLSAEYTRGSGDRRKDQP